MDGTFKTVPYIAGAKQLPWTQLLSIHGVVKYDGVIMGSIPLVYMLLIGKSAKVYETAFEGLVENVKERYGIDLSSRGNGEKRTIMLDFEKGERNMAMKMFNATVLGCYFHFCQAFMKNLGNCGFRRLYSRKKGNPEFRKLMKMLMATAFLPIGVVEECCNELFGELKALLDNKNFMIVKLGDFESYFAKTWMTRFPPKTWNVMDLDMRTNNYQESWHMQWNRIAGRHPRLDDFIMHAKKQEAVAILKYKMWEANRSPGPKVKKYRENAKKYSQVRTKFGDLSESTWAVWRSYLEQIVDIFDCKVVEQDLETSSSSSSSDTTVDNSY